MLLPYDLEWTCFSCNVIKRKNDLTKTSGGKIGFFNRLKYAQHKIFCICVEAWKIYEDDNFYRIYVLSIIGFIKFKNEKIEKE